MLLNEMITRQSFKIRKKLDWNYFFCVITFEGSHDRRWLRLRNLDESIFDYNVEWIDKLERNNGHDCYTRSKVALVNYLTKSFEIVDAL